MTTIATELKLRLNSRSAVPYTSRYYIHPEDKIYLDRKDDKLWNRTYEVTRTFEEYVHVQQPDKDAQYGLYHLPAVSGSDDAAMVKNIHPYVHTTISFTLLNPNAACNVRNTSSSMMWRRKKQNSRRIRFQ